MERLLHKAGNSYPRIDDVLWQQIKTQSMKQGTTSYSDATSLRICVYKDNGHLSSASPVDVLFSPALAAFLYPFRDSNSQKIPGEEAGDYGNGTVHSEKCNRFLGG